MSKRTSNLILAAAVVGFLAALAFFLHRRYFTGPDTGAARREVQRYYDARFPGAVSIRSCEYVQDPAGADHSRFRCTVAANGRVCAYRPLFSVPREDPLTPQNFDAEPLVTQGGPPRC